MPAEITGLMARREVENVVAWWKIRRDMAWNMARLRASELRVFKGSVPTEEMKAIVAETDRLLAEIKAGIERMQGGTHAR
jgi:predicted mannosyl-3-phosphoglycerate phosphatase (HAD superfamily)